MFVALLSALALAQEPQTFDPIPLDHEADGKVYQGILIDEATFTELLELRKEVQTQGIEIQSFVQWKETQTTLFDLTVTDLRTTCDDSLASMRVHYDRELDRSSKRKFFEKHGLPLGVAIGVTVTTVLAVGTIAAVSEVYEVQVIR